MRFLAVLALAASALSGCDKEKLLEQPAMAVAPGYIRLDSGKQLQVFGYDHCPGADYALVGRIESRNMEKHCTIVGKGDQSFNISVGTAVGMVVERWRVISDTRTIKLARPNGDVVTVFRMPH
nr:hypothetical protein [Pseudomonas fluorescens]